MFKFETTTKNIGEHVRDLKSDAVENVISNLEYQAIKILIASGICAECYYSPPFPSDGESWRQFWVNEAHHQCENFEFVGEAGSHLSDGVRAAVNVLLTASSLRQALASGPVQQVAALTMVLMSDTVEGSLSIDLTEINAKNKETKRIPYSMGIGKRNDDLQRMRANCIDFAAKRWNKNPDIRTGKMATEALDFVSENFEEYKSMTELPKDETVAQWLRAAHQRGDLEIPATARKGGKPRASTAKPCTR